MPLNLTVARERIWHRTSFHSMGSVAELMLDGPASLVPLAADLLRELERVWSRFDPRSELADLHRSGERWVDVSPEMSTALRWCARMWAETDGLFDPRIRVALEAWGYDRTFREVERTSAAPAPSPCPVSGRPVHGPGFEMQGDAARVRLRPGVSLDLGGIGKGLAADLVAAALHTAGATAAYVSIGGDIHAVGEPPDGGWSVPLLDPRTGEAFAEHRLHDGAIVMSTTALRTWQRGGIHAHHLIDPRTGAPCASDVVAVAVAARSAARGEALAKAAVIAGSMEGARLLERSDVEGWLLTASATIHVGAQHAPDADAHGEPARFET